MCVAVPGTVASIGDPSPGLVPAVVEFPDRAMTVNLVMLPDAQVGDQVITHSGYAIRIFEPRPASVRTNAS